MVDKFIENVDPKLQERIEECKRLNSTLPLTKEIVKYKILERRAQQGLGIVDTTFDGEKTFPLTVEEEEKRKRRREQNKKAAARCRDRRRLRDKLLTREFGEELKKNASLRESWKKLKAEKDGLVNELIEHEKNCPVLAQRGKLSYNDHQKCEDNEIFHMNNNNMDGCHNFLANKSKPIYDKSNLDILSDTNVDDKLYNQSTVSYDMPYTFSLFQNGASLKNINDKPYLDSSALNFANALNEGNIASFAYHSPPPSPSFSIGSSPTCFPFPSLSPRHFPSVNIPPFSIPPTSASSFLHTENLLDSLQHIGVTSTTNAPNSDPSSSSHVVYQPPLSPQASSLSSPSQLSPISSYSFSFSPSSSPFSNVFSPSTQHSDFALPHIFVRGDPNFQSSDYKVDDNLLDPENLIPSINLYNRSENSISANSCEIPSVHNPQQDTQHQHNPLLMTKEEANTHTQCRQDSNSGDDFNNSIPFPSHSSQKPPEQTYSYLVFKDVSDQYDSNKNGLDLQAYF